MARRRSGTRANSSLASSQSGEGGIRKNLIEAGTFNATHPGHRDETDRGSFGHGWDARRSRRGADPHSRRHREAPAVHRPTGRLLRRRPVRGGTDKLVWLLDHEYSEAGLSFDGLKNTDAAVARVLTQAAERVECEAHAAVVHIEQYGGADYTGRGWGGWDGEDEEEWEMGDVADSREWLDGWARPDGRRPPLGEVELLPGELLPRGALDDATPDEQRVHEASGNEGVSVERAYRRAALVLWPRSKALEIVARSDIAGAIAWVADEFDRLQDTGGGRIRELLSGLIDVWPTGPYDEDAHARALMLCLLHSTGDENRAARFLRRVVLKRYDGSENEPLALVVDMLGSSAARRFLTALAAAHLGHAWRPPPAAS